MNNRNAIPRQYICEVLMCQLYFLLTYQLIVNDVTGITLHDLVGLLLLAHGAQQLTINSSEPSKICNNFKGTIQRFAHTHNISIYFHISHCKIVMVVCKLTLPVVIARDW